MQDQTRLENIYNLISRRWQNNMKNFSADWADKVMTTFGEKKIGVHKTFKNRKNSLQLTLKILCKGKCIN